MCRVLHKAAIELRDHWLAKVRHGNITVIKVDVPLIEDVMEARNASDRNQKDNRLPRDIVLCDDDDSKDDEGTGSLHWVPYVHFGV